MSAVHALSRPPEPLDPDVPPEWRDLLERLVAAAAGDRLSIMLRDELAADVARAACVGGRLETRRVAERIASLQQLVAARLFSPEAGPEHAEPLLAAERLGKVMAAAHAATGERMLRAQAQRLEELANTDPLTGLRNVRFMRERMREMASLYRRYGRRFGLLLVDLDDFKRVNDTFGHAAGDRILVRIADTLRESLRTDDVAVRLGGDEFCVLTPSQTILALRVLSQRIGAAVRRVRGPDGAPTCVSIGIVACPRHGEEPDRLLDLADRAMYVAKASSRCAAVALPDDIER